jgi:hypothetical protein
LKGNKLRFSVLMNAVAEAGFEFAGMTPDEIVMRREIQ